MNTSPASSSADARNAGPPRAFRSKGRLVVVRDEGVRWIEACGRSVRIHALDGTIEVSRGLAATVACFSSGEIVRIHRSSAVHVQRVVEMQPEAHGDWWLRLDDGTRLRLSRTYRRAMMERLRIRADARR